MARTTDAQRIRAGIQALVRRFAVSERADVECCGMTVAQYSTLEVLTAHGPMRLGDLGRRLGITPSTLTRNLDRLESAGLVRRRAVAHDGRAFEVVLTKAGVKAAQGIADQGRAFNEQILDRIPPERRATVVAALDDLLVAVREATEECCPGAFDHLMTGFPKARASAAKECCNGRC
jgi:DNA-binding MarR family transcriptional regulator